jgi:hypothetical protein
VSFTLRESLLHKVAGHVVICRVPSVFNFGGARKRYHTTLELGSLPIDDRNDQ